MYHLVTFAAVKKLRTLTVQGVYWFGMGTTFLGSLRGDLNGDQMHNTEGDNVAHLSHLPQMDTLVSSISACLEGAFGNQSFVLSGQFVN